MALIDEGLSLRDSDECTMKAHIMGMLTGIGLTEKLKQNEEKKYHAESYTFNVFFDTPFLMILAAEHKRPCK